MGRDWGSMATKPDGATALSRLGRVVAGVGKDPLAQVARGRRAAHGGPAPAPGGAAPPRSPASAAGPASPRLAALGPARPRRPSARLRPPRDHPRSRHLAGGDPASLADPNVFVVMVAAILEEGAADGAVLVEVRFGPTGGGVAPGLRALFREAERHLEGCVAAAHEGLGGIDFRVDPYDREADPAL